MKLSEFENEQALDILADIIDPISVIMIDKEFVELARSGKPKIILAKVAIKQHKKEIIEIIAAMHGETPETYRFNLVTLTKDLFNFFNDPDLQMVFQSQGQTMQNESSGSATENTGDEEK